MYTLSYDDNKHQSQHICHYASTIVQQMRLSINKRTYTHMVFNRIFLASAAASYFVFPLRLNPCTDLKWTKTSHTLSYQSLHHPTKFSLGSIPTSSSTYNTTDNILHSTCPNHLLLPISYQAVCFQSKQFTTTQ